MCATWCRPCHAYSATFFSSRVGKLRVRDSLMGSLHWTGEEQVLDVGCGSGFALIGAAKRLTTGHATGVDIWSAEDLSPPTGPILLPRMPAPKECSIGYN